MSPPHRDPATLDIFDAAIHRIYAAVDLETFPEQVLPVLLEVTHSQCIGFCANAMLPGHPYVAITFAGDTGRIKWRQMTRTNYDDHPTARFTATAAPDFAVRLSDFFSSRAELEATRHYREHLHPIGMQHELTLLLDTALSQRLGISVARAGADYQNDEVDLLSRLGPHIKRAFHHAQTLAQLHAAAGNPERATAWREVDLTPRESEILRWIATGRTNREIADLLGVASTTVKTHLENIFQKLGVSNRAAAVAALRALPPPPAC